MNGYIEKKFGMLKDTAGVGGGATVRFINRDGGSLCSISKLAK
jgi:hypothetical protein